jgi:hypothetical protein
VGPKVSLDDVENRKFLTLLGLELQPFGCPAHSQLLYQLCYPSSCDTGNVHSIIPNYRKLTGDVCNLPYSEKPFISRIVLSLMDRL